MRKTNFVLGRNGFSSATTNNADFKGGAQDNSAAQAALAAQGDLRNSHFRFGTHPHNFTSTSCQSFQAKNVSQSEKQGQAEKKTLMRGHHFDFGNESRNFTTLNRQMYNRTEMGTPANTQSKVQTGNELRKTHFQFGGE